MKLISAAFAALALSFSMLLVPSSATAVPAAYPGSIGTFCSFSVPTKASAPTLTVRMRVRAGNAVPTGHVTPRLYKRTASGTYKLIRHPYRLYTGGVQKFTFKHLARGKYQVRYHYSPSANSVYKPCTSSTRSVRLTR